MSVNFPEPLPDNFNELHVGQSYFIPQGRSVLLRRCGDCIGGVVQEGIFTVAPDFAPVAYTSRDFTVNEGQVVRVAEKPVGCTQCCGSPCVHLGQFDTDNLYRLMDDSL